MEAGIQDVTRRIQRRIRDWDLAQRLIEKVETYWKTRNDRDDLTLQESNAIYRDEDYGEVLPLSKKRNLDIDWTNHAEYRSDLRDIDPDMVNDGIAKWLKEHLTKKGPDSKKVRMKLPGQGTAVVDYDLTDRPADADVVTVWGSERKPRLAAMDLDLATPAEVASIGQILGTENFSAHDSAYASYCLNAIDRQWKAVAEKLKNNCLSTYRSNLLSWFRYALVNRANMVHFAGLNKALSAFVRDIPEAILGSGQPQIPKFKASWAFLNADRLEQAGRKVVKVVKQDAIEAGLWKTEEAVGESKPPLYYDSAKRFWYVPYSNWTYENRRLLSQMGFRLGRRIWYVEEVTPRIKTTFDIGGHGQGTQRVPTEPPTLQELDEWYYKTWLPKNINRFQNLFENYIREAGSRITMSFSVSRNGKVNVTLTRGVKKTSDAIEELRLRYLGRQGRGPWLEVMDRFLELQRTRGDNALHVIDRMNNLEHSNGMFMERFPANVQSWYLKFLNAKFSAPRVSDLAKYIKDPDLREFIIYVSGDQWKVKRYDEPDYRYVEKEGPPPSDEPDWLALGYPYEKGFTKPMRDDPEVQKNLEELRELERFQDDPQRQREIREWIEKHPLRYASETASDLGPPTFAGLVNRMSTKVRLSTDWPSEEARAKYLKEHPNADKSKHTVKQEGKKPGLLKSVGKSMKKRSIRNKFTDELMSQGEGNGVWGNGYDGSVAVSGSGMDARWTDDDGNQQSAKIDLEKPENNPEPVKALLREHGLWDKVQGVSKRLREASFEEMAERIAATTVAKKKQKTPARQTRRMPTDRNLGTRVHPDVTKFQKRNRKKDKEELRSRY